MKEQYDTPKMEVILLEKTDILLTSNPWPEGSGDDGV